jgi:tetratricopeptide (TPR) repeat protein
LVVVKPCKLPTLSDHFRRCELFGVPEDAARLRFREFVEKRGAPTDVAFPGKMFAVSNIPIRVPTLFMGRGDALGDIETKLKLNEGRVAITALHGLRGVGKTTLAAAYADQHRGDYRATWWIRAETEPGIRADLVALGIRLGWVVADDKEEPAVKTVTERLRHDGEGILLIFDNAIDANALKPYLPRGGGARVLVTSNAHAWRGVATPIEVAVWSRDIGADYLIARTGREAERTAAQNLSQALGGLPLAHEQAAAYCERLDISLGDYRKRFETTPVRLLDDARHAPAEYHDGLTVAKTFALAIEETANLDPAAEPLIVHAALLAPEAIPLFLFAEEHKKLDEPLATALADDGLHEAVAALRTFALVNRETILDERDASIKTDCIRLHRLVREVAAARQTSEAREHMRRTLVEVVTAAYPQGAFDDPRTWPRARRLDAIALALVDCDTEPPPGAEKQAAELLNRLAGYRHHALAAYAQQRLLTERALKIIEGVMGPEHPDTAQLLNDFAFAIEAEGDPARARPLYERALGINEKVLGLDHQATAENLHNLGRLLILQGDPTGGRALIERSLAINEKVFGQEHRHTSLDISMLAGVLQRQGDLAGSRVLYERALVISEKALGPEHFDTARNLNSLAGLLRAQGELTAARPLAERALAINEKTLGPEHPKTAWTLNDLALVLQDQGDLAQARSLFERALAIRQKTLGPEHPNTNRVRQNLARLLLTSGNVSEALGCSAVALVANEKALGQSHDWTKESAQLKADALVALGRAEEAAALRACYKI